MRSINIKTIDNGLNNIGIVDNNETIFFIPKYFIDEQVINAEQIDKDLRSKLKLLVKALYKFDKNRISKGLTTGNDNLYNFDVVLSIVNDFIENGLYFEFEKYYSLGHSGKIDFPKTFKKCKPMYTFKGPVYLNYITSKKKEDSNELIKKVQTLVLNDISKKIGWLIGYNIFLDTKDIDFQLGEFLLPLLEKEKHNTFNSRKQNLISLLSKYIDMYSSEKGTDGLVFCTAFSLWEEMVRVSLSNVSKKDKEDIFYVRHVYRNINSRQDCKVLPPLMPDAVYKDDYSIYILDGKYYCSGQLPNNDDITKQFVYMIKAIETFKDDFCYRNIFVLPTSNHNYLSPLQVEFDVNIKNTDDLPHIELMYLNFEELLRAYVENRKCYSLLEDVCDG